MRTCSVADPTVVRMTVSLSCTLLLLTAVQLSVGTAFINVYSKKLLPSLGETRARSATQDPPTTTHTLLKRTAATCGWPLQLTLVR